MIFNRCRSLCIGLLLITLAVFIVLYYHAVQDLKSYKNVKEDLVERKFLSFLKQKQEQSVPNKNPTESNFDSDISESNEELFNYDQCVPLKLSDATIRTVDTYENFTFNAEWIKQRAGIWQDDFEKRYNNVKKDHPLKVFILPHSHTDPGWLKTFVNYFDSSTKKILDLVVEKLMKYKELKFIWTEISFLDIWWQSASSIQRENFKKLVQHGRIEIMTGGWVMTDEANVHYHAMLDQLIEGHQWVKNNLEVSPKVGWSIDPFGQGSTVPHLLAMSDLKGAIIQRIHYSWKEYLARHLSGDFYWKSLWESKQSSEYTLLTHNMPFDIYSTRHSCGPQPRVCDAFEFNKKLPSMDDSWLARKVEELIGQYGRTASLFSHNVALVLVGGDFTYSQSDEFERQYEGYSKLINYINNNTQKFNGTTAQFGTPSEYFNEIQNRQHGQFPSLVGDFFPYADIFSTGVPAYWTGYFTTRPFYKLMSRDLEHNLRNAEILYTIAYNKALGQGQKYWKFVHQMERKFTEIVKARRNLGLFAHHDAITGTSKLAVMTDYLNRLVESIKNVVEVQEESLSFLLNPVNAEVDGNFLENNIQRPQGLKEHTKKIIEVKEGKNAKIVIFNSLTQKRVEVISLKISNPNVSVKDGDGTSIDYQVNPILNATKFLTNEFELIFVVKMSGMSVATFTIEHAKHENYGKIFCDGCEKIANFETEKLSDEIKIENSKIELNFNKSSGLLRKFKRNQKTVDIDINFGGYQSAMRSSGAYLFKPINEIKELFKNFPQLIIVIKGKIASDVILIRGDLMTHRVRTFNTSSHLDEAVTIKNEISLNVFPRNSDVEFFMRLSTSIKNGADSTEFYTDQNGFQWLPRRKVPSLGVEANYYPITSSTFMQDDSTRLTLMTTHAQGAASYREGQIEVMLDRKIRSDDNRGMGEGVMDSIRIEHNFFLTLEFFNDRKSENYQTPSLFAQHLTHALNYPLNIFTLNRDVTSENKFNLLSYDLPCDFHLVNLRTLRNTSDELLPSKSALMIIHRFGYDCQFEYKICNKSNNFHNLNFVNDIKVTKLQRMSLTGNNLRATLSSFDEPLESMEIRSYNVTF